jgi:hypothetical protein
VATANFCRTFHHDGKLILGWWRGGVARPPSPFIISTTTYKVVMDAPDERAGIHFPYFSSTPICTLWFSAFLKSLTYYPLFRLQLSVFLSILIFLIASSRNGSILRILNWLNLFLREALFLITVPVYNNVRTKWKFRENAQAHICTQILCRIWIKWGLNHIKNREAFLQ